jgi:heme o synthase
MPDNTIVIDQNVTLADAGNSPLQIVKDYLSLTKPAICLLVLVTGVTALIWEGVYNIGDISLVLLSLFLTAGSANALNQYLERDRDALMVRTAKRRVLPNGRMKPRNALIFALATGIIGTGIFAFVYNWLSAVLALGTIVFYAFFYTLYLKPRTPQNIVIGGISGAMGPIIAWAAVAQSSSTVWAPLVMVAVIFFWTPPHFWSLALCLQDDYKSNPLPMMPNVAGEESTLRQMLVYNVILFVVSLSLVFCGAGWIYLVAATLFSGAFLAKNLIVARVRTKKQYWSMFFGSLFYLFALFAAIMVDAIWNFPVIGG